MTIVGQTKVVGQVAARLMERLARKFGKDEGARVEAVVLITAVRHGEGERLTIHYDTSSGLALGEGRALLRHADTLISRDSSRTPRPTEEAS